ncbi:hypothetical protein GH714_006862 [Hevea brasiliensis]|uniref:Uncharacterized protein n=1 Tax=Hevea brasiliensis TaxID=3981 RepID=A0A6A6M810_HEVBR|nr:hypothetical protein GH714_006862 [Hevea brasiliensis]
MIRDLLEEADWSGSRVRWPLLLGIGADGVTSSNFGSVAHNEIPVGLHKSFSQDISTSVTTTSANDANEPYDRISNEPTVEVAALGSNIMKEHSTLALNESAEPNLATSSSIVLVLESPSDAPILLVNGKDKSLVLYLDINTLCLPLSLLQTVSHTPPLLQLAQYYISYSKLSPTHAAFLMAISSIDEPRSFS